MSATATVLPFPAPLPPRRLPPATLPLRARVWATPAHDHPGAGEVRGVVHRPGDPLYDVLTDDGRLLSGLPARRVEVLSPGAVR